jgi:hypothetical protein
MNDERDPGAGVDGADDRRPTPAAEVAPPADAAPTRPDDAAADVAPVPPAPGDPAFPPADAPPAPPRRPLVERVGMALIAAVLATLFAGVGAAAFLSGEPFLGVMAGIGAAMTAWVGALTLLRG